MFRTPECLRMAALGDRHRPPDCAATQTAGAEGQCSEKAVVEFSPIRCIQELCNAVRNDGVPRAH